MKTYLAPLTLLFLACSPQAEEQQPQENTVESAVKTEIETPPAKFIITPLKDGEYDMPRNSLAISIGNKNTFLDTVSACEEIPTKAYAQYEIPKNALNACGGWWAGAGEYFYIIREGNFLKVYEGWQDETQEDEGYHWKEWKAFELK